MVLEVHRVGFEHGNACGEPLGFCVVRAEGVRAEGGTGLR